MVKRLRPVHVLLGDYRIRRSSPLGSSYQRAAWICKYHHQVRLPLRGLTLVPFEHDGTARQSGSTDNAAEQHRQSVLLLLHDTRDVVGVHLTTTLVAFVAPRDGVLREKAVRRSSHVDWFSKPETVWRRHSDRRAPRSDCARPSCWYRKFHFFDLLLETRTIRK